MKQKRFLRRQRGMGFLIIMLLLVVLLAWILLGITAAGVGSGVTSAHNALQTSDRRANVLMAQQMGQNGVQMAYQWLAEQDSAPEDIKAFAPSQSSLGTDFFGASVSGGYNVLTLTNGTYGDGTIKVRFYPQKTNEIQTRKAFLLESIGEFNGNKQIYHALVQQETFAKYAYFLDTAPTNWWMTGAIIFNGPVHINGLKTDGSGVIDTAATIQIGWRAWWNQPIFAYPGDEAFTTSLDASQITWKEMNNSMFIDPSYWGRWMDVLANNKAPKTNQPIIKMPTSNLVQEKGALGGQAKPTSMGVLVPNDGSKTLGGIYVEGDVDKINLKVAGAGSTTQNIEIFQTDASSNKLRTTISLDRTNNQTSVQKSRDSGSGWSLVSLATYSGSTNGALYVNGNVGIVGPPAAGGVSGIVANCVMSGTTVVKNSNLDIVTPPTKTLNISGGIVYADQVASNANPNNPTSNSTVATTTSGVMGLVSGHMQVLEEDAGGTPITDIALHATVFSSDKFDVIGYDTRSPGSLKILGGYIAKKSGKMGVFNATTNSALTGFVVTRNYDTRVNNNPPSFFPNTENTYAVLSLSRVLAPLSP